MKYFSLTTIRLYNIIRSVKTTFRLKRWIYPQADLSNGAINVKLEIHQLSNSTGFVKCCLWFSLVSPKWLEVPVGQDKSVCCSCIMICLGCQVSFIMAPFSSEVGWNGIPMICFTTKNASMYYTVLDVKPATLRLLVSRYYKASVFTDNMMWGCSIQLQAHTLEMCS